ncbi:MAG TPA: enoyl-CoA hydratase/isomerase family protein [Marmoricola sp.]|nr:enoyl-CoA hydratase/isomerase family protein [Marmoricola sp.]
MLPDADTLAKARLQLDIDGPVATITLDEPDRRNSQTPSMWHGLAAIGANLPEEVRVVVLKGAGDCFSAGIDLRLFGPEGLPGEEQVPMTAPEEEILAAIESYQAGFAWLRDPRWVSIAQVHSHAIGAGFQLALACDLRVVCEDAQFCMKEPALGLVPDLTGTKPLVDLVGPARALEMCATARLVGAAEARETGIASVVVPADELDATTADLAAAILANDVGAVRETKALLAGAPDNDLAAQCRAEREAQARRFAALAGGPATPGTPAQTG